MKYLLLFGAIISLFASCINLEDTVVDEETFLGDKTNSTSIYSKKSNGTFLNPFNINTDNWGLGDIERLMLVEFKPLHEYRSVELQIINNEGEKGGLVIMYYAEKEQADVYHTPNLVLSEEMYANVLNNALIIATPLDYELKEEKGLLKASLNFQDRFGNQINMVVNEKTGEMTPCGLLAPIGGEADNPAFMTIVFMKHFKFLSQKEKEILVEINGEKAELLKLPVKANGIKGYQTKYSMEPVTVSWNINANDKLTELKVNNDNIYRQGDVEIECLNNDGHLEIKRFSGIQNAHYVNFKFSPAIPDLQCLKENIDIKGRFSMSVDEVSGIVAGEYVINKQEGEINFFVEPSEGYSPVPGKAWMKQLSWNARITEIDKEYTIKSEWIKK
jgi:hypothetical protein